MPHIKTASVIKLSCWQKEPIGCILDPESRAMYGHYGNMPFFYQRDKDQDETNRDYLEFMAGIDKGCLLKKISRKKIFDPAATKQILAALQALHIMDGKEKYEAIQNMTSTGIADFAAEYMLITGKEIPLDTYVYVYPDEAIQFADAFIDKLAPELKTYLNPTNK